MIFVPLLVGAILIDAVRGLFFRKPWMAPRLLAMGWAYLASRVVVIVIAGMQWLASFVFLGGAAKKREDWAYTLQTWWARSIMGAMQALMGFRFEALGEDVNARVRSSCSSVTSASSTTCSPTPTSRTAPGSVSAGVRRSIFRRTSQAVCNGCTRNGLESTTPSWSCSGRRGGRRHSGPHVSVRYCGYGIGQIPPSPRVTNSSSVRSTGNNMKSSRSPL